MSYRFLTLLASVVLLAACNSGGNDPAANTTSLISKTLVNKTAYIPPQCYTKTVDSDNRIHNPCFSCHIESRAPNYSDDADRQLTYDFVEPALNNNWSNLFVDRSGAIGALSDKTILEYVREDNYLTEEGRIRLADRLVTLPTGWDYDGDGSWSGFVPDARFNFDAEGFDRTLAGGYSGWRAFGYTPFLGTFWPTNGSTDDVLVRLPALFQQNLAGEFDVNVYKLNLGIIEAMIQRKDIPIDSVDEAILGVDLDRDGSLSTATQITYDWAPNQGREMSYVGRAMVAQSNGEVHIAAGLFPEGTEFLHSVRYLDLDADGKAGLAPRMKELRYAKKLTWNTYSQLQDAAFREGKERNDFPNRVRFVVGDMEQGVSNGQGWVYQGFIEDADGELRPQTYEESIYCVGCHGGIGATTDGIFSFARKLGSTAHQQGWFHWSQRGLASLPEPVRSDGEFEYSHYLVQNGAGDEFRENGEVTAKFFDAMGELRTDAVDALHTDISQLLLPTAERALLLNKAYRTIVLEQSYIHGRDALPVMPVNVHTSVDSEQSTGIVSPLSGP